MFREKILSYVPHTEEMRSQSTLTRMHLMRKNLSQAIMMMMVWGFSCESWQDEWSLMLTEAEIQQAMVFSIKLLSIVL